MKFMHLFAAAALLCGASTAFAQAQLDAPCQAKFDAISSEIEAARAGGHKQKVRGLERAQKELSSGCTEAKLQAAHDGKVRSQEKKVAERERDLEKAKSQSSASKVASRQKKLDEEKAELQRLKDAPL
ncbi:DUF1090 domain-containing protein [Variovorax sp. HJSM1_2]|uniref:DUF1090 domain-containing protein n=1 Tax=Variovorax sp. HJSM1_2 TaxID=3366263 RepID=UPI003BCD8074